MIYLVISRESNGHYYDKAFTNEELAIKRYEYDSSLTFCGKPIFSSVQLFVLDKDPQEPGIYPIYKPIKKYVNGKWVKTKFYKKFMCDTDKYFQEEFDALKDTLKEVLLLKNKKDGEQ